MFGLEIIVGMPLNGLWNIVRHELPSLHLDDGIGVFRKNIHNKEEFEKNDLFNFAEEKSLEMKVLKAFLKMHPSKQN